MLCVLGWPRLARAVPTHVLNSALPIGKYGQCAVLCCLCTYLADMAVDASCQQQSVNIGSTVIACMACTSL